MQIDISEKVVVITGASRGIGKHLALRFAAEGAKVVINYLSSKECAMDVCNMIRNSNGNCIAVKADVTKQDQVKQLCMAAMKEYGQVDVLINNVGICRDNLITMMAEDQWKQVIDANLNSVYYCSRAFSKEMIKKRKG